MEKGICFYYGYATDIQKRAEKIKKAGFTCIIANADKKFNSQNGSIRKQVKLFKKNNLKLSSLHMQYNSCNLPSFWQKCKLGDKLERNLKKDVKIAKKYGFKCVVVHLKGAPNKIGFDRLERILKLCKKTNIPLAIENTTNKECFVETFKNIKSDYLKFCYDSGHGNVFNKNFNYLELYLDKLICLHLHDNNGQSDQHTLNKYGTIDWDYIARTLSKCPNEINLDYEILMVYRQNETNDEVLKETIKQANELEKLIEKYKKENKKTLKN